MSPCFYSGSEQKASSFMYQRSQAEGQVKQEKGETKQAVNFIQ